MTLIRVESLDDPRLAPYAAIRERDLVGRDGRFVAEGEVVLERLIHSSRCRAESLLLLDRTAQRLEPLLRELDPAVPVYVAPQALVDRLVGFPLHRGILAIGIPPAALDADALLAGLPPRATVMALIGLTNHDNVGGAFRNAAAFGVDAVLLDEACCDPLYRKAIRVSVGAALAIPYARVGAAADLPDILVRSGFTPFALSPAGAASLGETDWPARVALLFGAEGPGLPASVMAACRTLRIPIAAGIDSLNVATATGIVLHAVHSRRPLAAA